MFCHFFDILGSQPVTERCNLTASQNTSHTVRIQCPNYCNSYMTVQLSNGAKTNAISRKFMVLDHTFFFVEAGHGEFVVKHRTLNLEIRSLSWKPTYCPGLTADTTSTCTCHRGEMMPTSQFHINANIWTVTVLSCHMNGKIV